MSKKGSLFSLIKSLTKSEKRYFRLSNPPEGRPKNYLEVFDFFDQQASQNDKAASQYFAHRSFGKQLHVTKNYLTQQLLKSLRNYHGSSTVRTEIHAYLIDVEILFKKELYNQCADCIKRAKKLAEKYEKFNELLEILSWERRLLVSEQGSQKAINQINKIIAQENNVIKKLENINQYIDLTYNLFGGPADEAFTEKLKDHKLSTDISSALSFSATAYYYHLQYVLHTFGGNPEKGFDQISALINEFEKRPFLIKENPDSYVTALNNKLGAMLHIKKPWEEALKLLYKIREVPKKYGLTEDNYVIKVFIKTYNVELELYRDMGEWEKGLALINEIKSFLKNNLRIISDGYLISFHYQFSYIHFKKRNYSQALHDLNVIINMQSAGRQDIQVFARFLLLIIHYELGNTIVLRYAVDATRRFLKKIRNPYGFELKLLKFFSRLSTVALYEQKQLFQTIQMDLFQGLEEKKRANILDYLNFEDWLNEKVASKN